MTIGFGNKSRQFAGTLLLQLLVACSAAAGPAASAIADPWDDLVRRAEAAQHLFDLENVPAATLEARRALEIAERLQEAVAAADADPQQRARWHESRAVCLLVLDRLPEALQAAEAALALRRQLHEADHADLARSLALAGRIRFDFAQSVEALDESQAALAMQRRLFAEDHPDLAGSLARVGVVLHGLGRLPAALEQLGEAAALYERLERPVQAAAVQAVLAECYADQNDNQRSEEAARRCVDQLHGLTEQGDVPPATLPLASALSLLGRHDDALQIYERFADACRDAGNPAYAAGAQLRAAVAASELDDFARAVTLVELATEIFTELAHARGLAHADFALGRIELAQSKPDAALERFRSAAAALERLDRQPDAAWMLYWQALGHAAAEDDQRALAASGEAVDRFTRLEHPEGSATSVFERAQLLLRLERHSEAVADFERAAAIYERLEQPASAAWMVSWQGDCYRQANDDDQAVAAYTEATERFAKLRHDEGLAITASNLGQTLFHLQRNAEALAAFQDAAAAYERLDQTLDAAWMFGWQGDCHAAAGDDAQAMLAYVESVRRFAQLDFDEGLAFNANQLGRTLRRLERYADAARPFQVAAAAYERLGHAENAAWMFGWQGDCYRDAGEDVEAAMAYGESVRRFEQLDHEEGLAISANQLGRVLRRLERYADAAEHFHTAATAYERLGQPIDAAWMFGWQGDSHRDAGEDVEAAVAYGESVRRFEQLDYDEGLANNANQLGRTLHRLQRFAEAAEHFQAAVAAYERLDQLVDAAWMYDWQGACHRDLGDDERAVATYGEAARRFAEIGFDLGLAQNSRHLANALSRLRRSDEALAHFQAAASAFARLYGGDHAELGNTLMRYAEELAMLGRHLEAADMARTALDMANRLYPEDHADKAKALMTLAQCLLVAGELAEPLELFESGLAMMQRVAGEDTVEIARGLRAWAIWLQLAGRTEQALQAALSGLAMSRRLHGEADHDDVVADLDQVGVILRMLGRHMEALEHYEAAFSMASRLHPDGDPTIASALTGIANCLTSLGRRAEALEKYQAALAITSRASQDHLLAALELAHVADRLREARQYAEALESYDRALEMLRRLEAGDSAISAVVLYGSARSLSSLGRWEEALPRFEQALVLLQGSWEPEGWYLAWVLNEYARCLESAGRPEDALPLFREAVALNERTGGVDGFVMASNLARLLMKLGELEGAVEAFEKAIRSLEAGRLRVGGDDLDRLSYAADVERRFSVFQGMVLAQLRRDRPDLALAYLERGRARTLLDLLERGQQLGGRDLLATTQERARAAGNRELVEQVATLRQWLQQAESRLAQLHAEIQQQRGRADRSEQQRQAAVDSLYEELRAAQEEHRRARRQLFSLAGDHATSDLKPLQPQEIQRLLRGSQRMLLYVPANEDTFLLVVPPPGEPIRSLKLQLQLDATRPAAGIGAMLNADAQRAVVQRVVPGGAAAIDGRLQPGDQILAVGEAEGPLVDVRGKSLPEVVELLRGTAGTTVRLEVQPADADAPQLYELTRRGLPVSARNLEALVERYVRAMQTEGRIARGIRRLETDEDEPDTPAQLGHALFRTLVPPDVWDELQRAELVYIVPDGALHRLPFEALLVEQPALGGAPEQAARERRYWLDQGPPIVYGPSATVLVNRQWARDQQLMQRARGVRPSSLVVALGNPLFHPQDAAAIEPPEQGCLVTNVVDDPARTAGIGAGEVIVAYDGQAVADDRQLRERTRAVADDVEDGLRPDEPILVTIWRGGELVELSLPPGPLGVEVARDAPREAWVQFQEGKFANLASVTRSSYVTRYGPLVPLPGTEREVLRIHETLTTLDGAEAPTVLLLREQATRSRLFASAAGARYLHLATHGLVDEDDQVAWSSLALTVPPIPTPDDFGFLTLTDLFQNWWGRLAQTELVVLSACDSQRGRISHGEGVFGMPWGFMYAGTPAVIASLWQVDDESTAELMGELYAEVHAIRSRTADSSTPATLQAFVAVRQALREKYPEPYFWSPFIYLGDPR